MNIKHKLGTIGYLLKIKQYNAILCLQTTHICISCALAFVTLSNTKKSPPGTVLHFFFFRFLLTGLFLYDIYQQ